MKTMIEKLSNIIRFIKINDARK